MIRSVLVVCALGVAVPAFADDGRAALFTRAGLGGGYGHYFYPDGLSSQGGRRGGGPMVSFLGDIGIRLANGFILAGAFTFEPIVSMHSTSPRGTEYPNELGPGGIFGVTVGAALDRFTLTATLGLGGGGSPHAAGFGFMFAPSVAFSVIQSGRHHLQVFVRPVYGLLTVFPGISMYVAGTGGLSYGWQ